MVGRADKGLLITTGTFTREARKEAQRDGAPPLDLIDGEDLVEKLKELGIGVQVQKKVIEEVSVDESYFKNTKDLMFMPNIKVKKPLLLYQKVKY
jgi:restriction system protein